MHSLSGLQLIVLIATVSISGVFDVRERRIPNWITVPGLLAGLAFNGMGGLLGVLLALAVYIPLYLIRGMGAGDVKLMAAVGAIAGPENWIVIFLATSIIGGVAALGIVVARRRYHETVLNFYVLISDLAHFRAPYKDSAALDVRNPNALRMPHGLSIALGTLLSLSLAYGRLSWFALTAILPKLL